MAPVEVRVASTPTFCWTDEGEVAVGYRAGARCSGDRGGCVGSDCPSPDGALVARLQAGAAEESTLVRVEEAGGALLWERELAGIPADRVAWSSDAKWLLLGAEPVPSPHYAVTYYQESPIWRLAADGSGEARVAVEAGRLIGIVPEG